MMRGATTESMADGLDANEVSSGARWGRTIAARRLAAVGDWLLRRQDAIRAVQWIVVGFYFFLVSVPAFLPIPASQAHIWNNLTLLAQFAFWGIWWPFVLLSMVLVGRVWCGLLCPEGALSEAVSRHGRGRAIPRWVTWKGWPFVAFVATTVYGQMVSVYQYAAPALVVLGGSTAAAMVVGWLWGRNKRVWCRYLCPVSGVFALLAKLAPLHFRTDPQAWRDNTRHNLPSPRVECAPLVPIKTMKGASQCHMCGRCSGYKKAVTLSFRSPSHEIVHVAGATPKPWETALIVFGLMGVAAGAFQWSSSAWYVDVKQALAERLVDAGAIWALKPLAPWWILTNYPAQNDVLTLLDGAILLFYIFATALVIGLAVTALLGAATRISGAWSAARFHHLAQSLIPLAGCGVFLGLSALTVTMAHNEGVDILFVDQARMALLIGATLWGLWLAWRILGLYSDALLRRTLAILPVAGAFGIGFASWFLLFWSV